eukprot:g51938.t1
MTFLCNLFAPFFEGVVVNHRYRKNRRLYILHQLGRFRDAFVTECDNAEFDPGKKQPVQRQRIFVWSMLSIVLSNSVCAFSQHLGSEKTEPKAFSEYVIFSRFWRCQH